MSPFQYLSTTYLDGGLLVACQYQTLTLHIAFIFSEPDYELIAQVLPESFFLIEEEQVACDIHVDALTTQETLVADIESLLSFANEGDCLVFFIDPSDESLAQTLTRLALDFITAGKHPLLNDV